MKINLLILTLLFSFKSFSNDGLKVIYGEEDRFEPFEIDNPALEEASKSVAAIVSNYSLINYGDSYQMAAMRFGDIMNFCPGVPFQGQPKAARCSAFLIGPDTIATAGHCMKSQWDCRSSSFVFDYRMDKLGEPFPPHNRYSVKKTSVYRCKEIIKRKLDKVTKEDWAIVKLNKAVKGIDPLKLRKYGTLRKGDALALMGFPSGLPLKIADKGQLRSNNNKHYFVAELDAFHVNSGSPVINERTMEVEGILVRGEKDFETFSGCDDLKICESGKCRGEDVTKITSIPLDKLLD